MLKHLRMLFMSSVTKEVFEKATKWFDKVEWDQEQPPEWWEASYNRADKFVDALEDASVNARMRNQIDQFNSNRRTMMSGPMGVPNFACSKKSQMKYVHLLFDYLKALIK